MSDENSQTVAWDEAYNATNTLPCGIKGFINAAFTVEDERPALGGPERETVALRPVLAAPREQNEALRHYVM